MSGLTAQIRVTTPFGYPIDVPLRINKMRAMRKVNRIGYFEIEIAAFEYPRNLFALDRRVEVSIQAAGRASRLAFIGLMRIYTEKSEISEYTLDYLDEQNYIYVGGQGKESTRVVRERSDTTAIIASPINRHEGFADYTNTTDTAILDAHGDKTLRENRVKTTLQRDLGSLDSRIYGADWDLGDTLKVAADVPDTIIIGGPCWNEYLARRVVAYKSGTAEAEKTMEADSMMYEYVDENLLNPTDTDRTIDAGLGFAVGVDYAACPSVTHSTTYGNLFSVLEQIAEKSQQAGTQLRFGLAPVYDGARYIPRFEAKKDRWGIAREWVLGNGTHNDNLEITGIDIEIDHYGGATVIAKTEDTV